MQGNPRGSRALAISYLVLCHLLWSTNNIVGRSLGGVLDPVTITSMRWILASMVFPALLGIQVIRDLRRYIGLRSLSIGLLGFALFNIVLYQALSLAPSSLVGLAYGFTPIAILVVGALAEGTRPKRVQVIGSILSIVGVSILFTYRGVYITRAEELLGLVLGILTGFIWAIYTSTQRRLYPEGDQRSITYASLLVATAVLAIASSINIYRESRVIAEPRIMAQLLWISILPGAVAYYMWNRAVSIVGSATAAPFSNLLPVFTALLGYIILGEKLGIGDLVGGVLIVTGSLISTLGYRRS